MTHRHLLVLAVASGAGAQPCVPSWSALGPGPGSMVYGLASFNDGSGAALFAGGLFSIAQGAPTDRIARWNGQAWSGVGGGMNNNVYSLKVLDLGTGPALYAGGLFTNAGGVAASRIARWNGQTWSGLGGGVNNIVWAVAAFDDGQGMALYAGGVFTTAGGNPIGNIAKWNGQVWSAVGGGTNGPVYALAVFDDGGGPDLYAGGSFTVAGSEPGTNNIARWNGETWSPLGMGLNGYIRCLTVFNNGGGAALYAGGQFSAIVGGVAANKVAKWDGAAWSEAGQYQEVNPVHSLAVFDDGAGPALYAATGFAFPAQVLGRPVTKLVGQTWVPLGSNTNDYVEALAVYNDGRGDALYAGGLFTVAGGRSARFAARWGCDGVCYPNCDGSTSAPILNVQDFICFINEFASGDSYANCDGSTAIPILNVQDFTCFLNAFGAGCS